jgi:hypothetical protein
MNNEGDKVRQIKIITVNRGGRDINYFLLVGVGEVFCAGLGLDCFIDGGIGGRCCVASGDILFRWIGIVGEACGGGGGGGC